MGSKYDGLGHDVGGGFDPVIKQNTLNQFWRGHRVIDNIHSNDDGGHDIEADRNIVIEALGCGFGQFDCSYGFFHIAIDSNGLNVGGVFGDGSCK